MQTIGEAIDELYAQSVLVDEATAALEVAKEKYTELEKTLIETFGKDKLEGAFGEMATAKIDAKGYPTIQDRVALNKWIMENDAFDLFQSRIVINAYQARADRGIKIPGIEVFTKSKIKLKRNAKR